MNLRLLIWMLIAFAIVVVGYSAIFHALMAAEGQSYSWTTSIYWTLTVMSTLGFGDITFEQDLGRAFSMLVLVTGAVFILVVLPFSFIQFVFMPWMKKRQEARAPRQLPDSVNGHLVLTDVGPLSDELIGLAEHRGLPYVLLVEDLQTALELEDRGYKVLVGDLDDPATYRAARVHAAALVAATRTDPENTNTTFTVREIDDDVPIAALVSSHASKDILQLAGASHVLHLGELMGQALARRVVGVDGRVHVIGQFGDLRIAEASVNGTELVNRTIRDADVRARTGVNILGVWQRGNFSHSRPTIGLEPEDVLILAGSQEQLAAYDREFGVDRQLEQPVLIIGGGRVGRAAARTFQAQGMEAVIVEQLPERKRGDLQYVIGDAAELEVLKEAGLDEAAAALVTTHRDDINIYLTLYLRKLRPDLGVIARATRNRNVSSMHRAGADSVLSYASLGSVAIFNAIGTNNYLLVTEGLGIFRIPIPASLHGRSLQDAAIGERTGCQVVGIGHNEHVTPVGYPPPTLPDSGDLLLIGDDEAHDRFNEEFGNGSA